MKLIDSDNQADLITKFILTHKDKIIDILQSGDNDFLFALMMQYFDAQKADCDVEKVVEKLENLEPFHVDGYGDVMVNIDDVIEIVKQGGCGINDVCEWKCPKEIMDNTEFEVSCNSNPLKKGVVPNNFSFCDFRYCPYCGKKIKVVD